MGTVSFGKTGQKKEPGWAQEVAAPRYPGHGPGELSSTDLSYCQGCGRGRPEWGPLKFRVQRRQSSSGDGTPWPPNWPGGPFLRPHGLLTSLCGHFWDHLAPTQLLGSLPAISISSRPHVKL